jgi:hypothetical protein
VSIACTVRYFYDIETLVVILKDNPATFRFVIPVIEHRQIDRPFHVYLS